MKSSNLCKMGAAEQSCWSLLMFLIDFSNPITQEKSHPMDWGEMQWEIAKKSWLLSVALSLSAGMSVY